MAQFADRVCQVQDLCVELGDQRVHLLHGVEHLDGLRVRVEAHLEGSRHARHPSAELLFGVLEALRHIVDGLVLLVLVRLDGRLCRLEGAQLGFVADRVQQFTVGGQQTGSVRLDFAILLAQAELDGEPVDLRTNETATEIRLCDLFVALFHHQQHHHQPQVWAIMLGCAYNCTGHHPTRPADRYRLFVNEPMNELIVFILHSVRLLVAVFRCYTYVYIDIVCNDRLR